MDNSNQRSEGFNWYGAYTLAYKETIRFLKVYNQAIFAPAVSALIFLSVFALAMPKSSNVIGDIKFVDFMGYGLIIMSIVQNAFANSSSSLIMAKVIGYVHDLTMPPLSGAEIVFGLIIGALVRGIVVGIVVALCLLPFVHFYIYHLVHLIFFTISSALLLGQLGILSGLAANSFEQSAAITSYVISPLSFLSGTFYSVERLPSFLQKINHYNPFFYMIDGFRYSLIDHADSDISRGILILISANLALLFILIKLINSGWRLKD